MKSHKVLAAILVMQVILLLNQWLGSPISIAQAQVPDAGAQRLEIIDQLKANNELLRGIDDKLDKLISILQSGKVQVAPAKSDDSQQK